MWETNRRWGKYANCSTSVVMWSWQMNFRGVMNRIPMLEQVLCVVSSCVVWDTFLGILFTCSNRSRCNLEIWRCFSFSPWRHLISGNVTFMPSSSASYWWCALLSSSDASICLIVVIIRWASSVISFFSAATDRTWLWRVSESAVKSYTH